MMGCFYPFMFLTALWLVHVTNGQTVALTGPSVVQQGNDTVFTCTVDGGTATQFVWIDDSVSPSLNIYSGGARFSTDTKYDNFLLAPETATSSVMTIENTLLEDEGSYGCSIPQDASDYIDLVVEVRSIRSLMLTSTDDNNEDKYIATCEATGGKPMETITWILDGETQSDGNGNSIENTNPQATPPLSNTKSVFTFPATLENYGQTLVCDITGHTLTELNGQESKELDIHTSPLNVSTTVTVHVDYVTQEPAIIVSCNAQNEPTPTMRNYYIYANDTLIHDSTDRVNQVTVPDAVVGTNYTCLAGNYLGNTSLSKPVTYDPSRTTIPPPTTETTVLGAGAIAGIVIGAILFVVIIVVIIYFVLIKGKDRTDGGVSAKKHGSSTVGTSNGSEKDKIKPVAAPRDQGSIQHTTDNPGQQEYAMVDRKKPPAGGDMPDTRGPGQESPGMHYADLDLSTNAGHTERQVPQNPDNVVVYSSILV